VWLFCRRYVKWWVWNLSFSFFGHFLGYLWNVSIWVWGNEFGCSSLFLLAILCYNDRSLSAKRTKENCITAYFFLFRNRNYAIVILYFNQNFLTIYGLYVVPNEIITYLLYLIDFECKSFEQIPDQTWNLIHESGPKLTPIPSCIAFFNRNILQFIPFYYLYIFVVCQLLLRNITNYNNNIVFIEFFLVSFLHCYYYLWYI